MNQPDPPIEGAVDTEIELENVKWRYRRRMAFAAFNSLLVLIFFPIVGSVLSPTFLERFLQLSDYAVWGFGALASIAAAYMGFATWFDVAKKK